MKTNLQHFAPDRAETYEMPENHAVDVLVKEIQKQQDHIWKCEKDINSIYENTEQRFIYMSRWVDQIKVHERRIQECRDAIKWIYNQIL